MFFVSILVTLHRTLVAALASVLKTASVPALTVTPTVHLFTAGPTPITPDFTDADFTEATFTGYSPKALTLLGPVNMGPNNQAMHGEVDFVAGAVEAPGQNILGYWIDNHATTPTAFYMAELFPEPIPIVQLNDFLSLDSIFPIPMQLATGAQ